MIGASAKAVLARTHGITNNTRGHLMRFARRRFIYLLTALAAHVLCLSVACAAERPNFVWILSEDNSKHYLKLFDEHGAATPAIERLASAGIAFDHAFSCGPVCSVARTTLMSGMYAPRIGFQYHRKSRMAELPGGAQLFPAYLRAAGYYTTNNSKKDYNVVEGKGVWDESSNKATWRKRPTPETPFFHMQTTGVSHESSLHFGAAQMKTDALTAKPDQVAVAPYHPDTPTFRYTVARYHDRIQAADAEVAKLVARLEEDGLLDDTFIFYFGDHGGVLPRSKGYVYESGLHVPLVVRVPEKWRHLVDFQPGSGAAGFVSFIDFGPTVLQLAGVDIPATIDGMPFLGPGVMADEVNARDEAFGYADRFDEKYDLCRSLRKGQFKYIRNYQAFNPDALQNNYRYRMLAYSEWRNLFHAGKLNAAQSQFFLPKQVEALYDLAADPHEVNNLAADPAYADVLKDLRGRLQQWVKGLPDLSFYPESYLVDNALPNGAGFGQKHKKQIARLVDVADLALLPFDDAASELQSALASEDPWQRYWALIVCSCFGERAKSLAPAAKELLNDGEPLVRVRAAEFLGLLGAADPRPTIYDVLATSNSPVETLLTLNTVVLLADRQPPLEFDLSKAKIKSADATVERRIEYMNSKR
jgi:uncharacterized sulfatase